MEYGLPYRFTSLNNGNRIAVYSYLLETVAFGDEVNIIQVVHIKVRGIAFDGFEEFKGGVALRIHCCGCTEA